MFKGIISLVFLGTAVAVFFVFCQPLYGDIKALNAQKISFEDILANSKKIQETKDRLLGQYNNISQENLERLDRIASSGGEIMNFVPEIENLTQKNGMILKNIDIKEDKKEKNVSFSLKFDSSYKSFYSFLNDVAKNVRLIDINSVNLTAGDTDFYEISVDGKMALSELALAPVISMGETLKTEEILNLLSLLNKVNFSVEFFNSSVFKGLSDFSVSLPVPETGKNNPFAP